MNRDPGTVVDARRLLCPLPVIRTQSAVSGLSAGAQVTVRCTDPGAVSDIPAWCRVNGHRVVSTREHGTEFEIVVEVGGGRAAR